MDIAIIILLLVVGVLLMLLEIFLLPGLSIAGVAGTLTLGGAVYYAYAKISIFAGNTTIFIALLLLGIAIYLFVKLRVLEKISLKTNINTKIDTLEGLNIKVGDQGITISRLAPMGKVNINGSVAEAKSFGDFIDEDTEIVVAEIHNNTLLVERVIK